MGSTTTWRTQFSKSEALAAEAAVLAGGARHERAVLLYRGAARAAELATEALDAKKKSTLGITVVHAASLWIRAGDFADASRVANKWLGTALLPEFATAQLEELLRYVAGRIP